MNKKHLGVYLKGKVFWIKYSRNGRPFRGSSHSGKIAWRTGQADAMKLHPENCAGQDAVSLDGVSTG